MIRCRYAGKYKGHIIESCIRMTKVRAADLTLLLEAIRPQPDIAAIRHCAGMIADWGGLVGLAQEHAVPQLLLRGLRAADLPAPGALQDVAAVAARRSLRLTGELLQASGALAAAGIPCLTFKGPSEGGIAYRNPSLRSFRDIDLIVEPACVSAAIGVLETQGYKAATSGPFRPLPGRAQILLVRREAHAAIDLHWRWTELPHLFDWSFAEAFERRITVNISGMPICTLPDEERFLFLCLHGGLHFWERLAWICDLAWEAAGAKFDADSLQRRARQLGVSRLLQLGLSLAHQLLGSPWPKDDAAMALPWGLGHLQTRIVRRLEAAVPAPDGGGRLRVLADHLLLRDTWGRRACELGYRGRRYLASAW